MLENAKAIANIGSKDNFLPGEMGPANIDPEYKYGRAVTGPSLEKPVTKSWLFEIVDRETGKIKESFTLILPPQAYSIKEPQRVSITKTFGNAFVDDYGPDNLQITLKGISGTTHVFPTFQTQGVSPGAMPDISLAEKNDAVMGYNGRDAFYYFRNNILRYKDKKGWEKNELRVYDLADEQAYKCVLLDFTLDRSSDRPLHYPFTISLFVYERLDNYKPKLKTIDIAKNPVTALDAMDSSLDKIAELYKNIQDIANLVGMIKARSLELRSRWNKVVHQVSGALTSPLDLARNLVEAAFALVGMAKDTYDAGKYTFDRYVGASEFARDILNNGLRIYGYQISEGWQRLQTLTVDLDSGINTEGGSVSPTSASDAVSRSFDTISYSFSGLNLYTVGGEDTLQSIALDKLGSEDLWIFIAYVNPDITSNDDLVSGTQIFIPVQVDLSDTSSKELFIFSEDISRDPYGTDIKIDSYGNLLFVNNDFVLVSGVENVRQAIDLRLNTEVGSLITQAGYGITAQAGFAGTTMALRYLKMAIRTTIMQDPRVESVDNMRLTLESDSVFIGMDIRIVGSEESLPVPLQL